MPVLEINPVAKVKRQQQRAEILARIQEMDRHENANYSVGTSRLAHIVRRGLPHNADAIILNLEQIYASFTSPESRQQFRQAQNINRAFTWARTPQGADFWEHIHTRTWRIAQELNDGRWV